MASDSITPGAWEVNTWGGLIEIQQADPDGVSLATMTAGTKADAELMAAAPELYRALISILEIGKRDMSNPKYDGYFDDARAAIAKAKGKEA